MSQKDCRNSDSRMKPRKTAAVVAGAAAFVVAFCMLTALAVCLAPPDYLLSRIEINPSYGDGYTMPETLEREIWTSMISTEYENGAETGQAVYRRAIGGDYTAEIVLPEEDSETLRGMVTGKEIRCDVQAAADGGFWEKFLAPFSDENMRYYDMYDFDENGRVEKIRVFDETEERTLISCMNFYYSDDGLLTKQKRISGDMTQESLGMREYFYDGTELVRTEDTSGDGTLLGSVEYTRHGSVHVASFLNEEGVPVGSEKTVYGPFGLILRRETFDAGGNLIREDVYHYRLWEWFRSPYGIGALAAIVLAACVSAASAAKAVKKRQERAAGQKAG